MVVVGGYEAAEGRTVLGRACDDACVENVPLFWLEEGLSFAADRRGKEERAVTGLSRVTEPVREG